MPDSDQPEPAFMLRRADEREVAVVVVEGAIDFATVPELRETLELFEAGTPVVLDLSDVEFMDSMGLRELLNVAKRLQGGLQLVGRPGGPLVRMLELMGIASYFNVHHARGDAMRSVRQ